MTGDPYDRPIFVVGMHRSGTSLTMRMLSALGVDIGRADTQVPPDPDDNADGYQEQLAVVELDDELLRRLGGHASEVPALKPGWEQADEFDRAVETARRLAGEFFTREPWALKDPRISVLLPFWRRVWPDLRVVVCVRNPLEVAESMQRRGASYSREHRLEAWLTHTSSALAGSAGADRAIVLYEDLLASPRKVADDLALFVFGQPPELAGREAAAAIVDPARRRSNAGEDFRGLPRELARYYSSVCDLARAQAQSRIAASVR
jgi:hypothetical protein